MEKIKEGSTDIIVKKGDITKEDVDVIVNAANNRLLGGGGVDGAIHRAAGPTMMEECRKIGYCPTGEAVYTTGGNLKAKYCIHTVGPIWQGGFKNEKKLLSNCYINSLKLANKLKAQTIAFPAISCGVYGYPIEEAAYIAINSIKEFLRTYPNNIKEIRLVLFNDTTYNAFSKALKNA